MGKPEFHQLSLGSVMLGPLRVIECLCIDGVSRIWFGQGAAGARISDQSTGSPLDLRAIPGGYFADVAGAESVDLNFDDAMAHIEAQLLQNDLFSGLNTLVALRHAESAEIARDWLTYHCKVHGAQAALIVDRGLPDQREDFANSLRKLVDDIAGLRQLVIVTVPIELGHPDRPAASHVFNAPAAPGKARMTNWRPDPFLAPLGETLLCEVLHRRFLTKARAVLNLDLSDLLLPDEDGDDTIFDRAVVSKDYLILTGREAYPWRLREGQKVGFGEHIHLQFDREARIGRWACVPQNTPGAVWRIRRIAGAEGRAEGGRFIRCMLLRHPDARVGELVPKSALIEEPELLDIARKYFQIEPQRAQKVTRQKAGSDAGHVTIVTCMKNEGPFILEWIAYHRSIGINRFLIYSNDCDDGTDELLDLLDQRGLVTHRQNPFRETDKKPQHAAFQAAESEALVQEADWLVTMDVDEFINIHLGAGHIDDLFGAIGDANMISMTWRLFGNSDLHQFEDRPVTEQFTRCAPQLARKPHQAWGFKTLYRHRGFFRKLGVHRPKGLIPQFKDELRWVNGSGRIMPESFYRNAWRSTLSTYGYDLVTLNHYAVRNAESFLVKRERGRVNHADRDQGALYWLRMNNNTVEDFSISSKLEAMQAELARLMQDMELAQAHSRAVARHRAKIAELRTRPDYAEFYSDLVSPRMEKISRLHPHFGSGVFWSGPHVIPDEVVARDPGEDFFFTVRPEGKGH